MTLTTKNSAREFLLEALAQQYPNTSRAASQIALLRARLQLPTGTIHILSDVHGENEKLRHVIHNASGSLRSTVEEHFSDRFSPEKVRDLLTLLYYPQQIYLQKEGLLNEEELRLWFVEEVALELEVLRLVAATETFEFVDSRLPDRFRPLFRELLFGVKGNHAAEHERVLLASLLEAGEGLEFLRDLSRAIRNISVTELIVAGDCGDRGPRIDQVIETIRHQPRVALTWGNHDMTWLGACLGHPLLIATVLRISLRYRRLSQLEEGYGVIMSPLEKLVRTCYADDPAERFQPKGEGLREKLMMARMQKAMAVLEFKLEGRAIRRNPQFEMEKRDLLSRVDFTRETITLEGVEHPLLDGYFPTVDPADPLALSPEEEACMSRIRQSFLRSQRLWRHMLFLKHRTSMYLTRDQILLFHGCLACDDDGRFLPMPIDGQEYVGRRLMEKLDEVIQRSFQDRSPANLDLLWYCWAGPNSPLFGKDRMATFERYLLADKATHKEEKNPYFRLIHEPEFCDRILKEFGMDPASGLIVNGHVPVKIEEGEDPLKKSGKAITIDGAFSKAYGDHGYTLVVRQDGIFLARHHAFDSVETAVEEGVDIIPTVTPIRQYDEFRKTAQSSQHSELQSRIELLQELLVAYRESRIDEMS